MSFTIGCDPELVCRIKNKFTSADKYFKAASSMGLDGNTAIAEVRPGYSESPIDLTAKIKIILEYGHQKHPELEFYSGHYQDHQPIGGHLHFSVSSDYKIVQALDTTLVALSNCIDDKEQRQRRQRTGYGKVGSHREKNYGMEYRFPGSWLLSPAITLVTLTLAKLSIIAVLEDNIDLKEIKAHQHSLKFLKSFKDYLKTVPEDCIEGLMELELLFNKKLNWNENILPHWGIAA